MKASIFEASCTIKNFQCTRVLFCMYHATIVNPIINVVSVIMVDLMVLRVNSKSFLDSYRYTREFGSIRVHDLNHSVGAI